MITIHGIFIENNHNFVKYIDKKLNHASSRLIYPEKIRIQKLFDENGDKFNKLQDNIEEQLNKLQDLLHKKY